MMCIEYDGTENNGFRIKELKLEAIVDNITAVIHFVDEELLSVHCPDKALNQINAAIDELFGNIAAYAYGDDTGTVTVRMETNPPLSGVTLSFIDQGVPFNPLGIQSPDITLSPKERKIGGLGFYLVRKTMDNVEYEYKDGKNILTIKKSW